MARLHEIQQTLKAPKSQYNAFGKYKYRSCEDILEAVKPLLGDSVLIISDDIINIGHRFYVKSTATFLAKETEPISVVAYAREDEELKGMHQSQITGASSSYSRKYALNGLFLIDDSKDSDSINKHDELETVCEPSYEQAIPNMYPSGQDATKKQSFAPGAFSYVGTQSDPNKASEKQVKMLNAICSRDQIMDIKSKFKIEHLSELSKLDAMRIIKHRLENPNANTKKSSTAPLGSGLHPDDNYPLSPTLDKNNPNIKVEKEEEIVVADVPF